jgi:hypothetical protein
MCVCFKERRQPALGITILSSLVLFLGLLITALAIKSAVGDTFFNIKNLGDLKNNIDGVDV